jgi:hypothetical protein
MFNVPGMLPTLSWKYSGFVGLDGLNDLDPDDFDRDDRYERGCAMAYS